MKKMLIALSPFIVVGVSFFYYTELLGGKYRITDEHPLGTLEAIEGILTESGFARKTFPKIKDPFRKLIKRKHGLTVIKFTDTVTKGRNNDDVENIWIALDSQGVIRAVKGDFYKMLGRAGRAHVTSTRIFMLDYWETTGGDGEPTFTEKPGTRTNRGYTSWVKFQNERCNGLWEQEWEYYQFIFVKSTGI